MMYESVARGRWRRMREDGCMCRSIKTLREPFTTGVTTADINAAALQYVRKIAGFRAPAPHNAEAFDEAVRAVAAATQQLLTGLVVRASGHTNGSVPAQPRPARRRG